MPYAGGLALEEPGYFSNPAPKSNDERMPYAGGLALEEPGYFSNPAPKSNDHKRTRLIKLKHLLEEYKGSTEKPKKSAQKNNVYSRPQPVKIKLLQEGESSSERQKKSAQKNNEGPKLLPERLCQFSEMKSEKKSERPRLQPERLGQYSEAKSARKSEIRSALPRSQPKRLGPFSVTKSAKTSGKQIGSIAPGQYTESSRCPRRFLNFNAISARTPKGKESNLPSQESAEKKSASKPQRKRSFLLPPNSIKQKHLQNTQIDVIGCSRISEVSREVDDTYPAHDSISAIESQIATYPPTISENKEARDKREIDAPSNRTTSRIPSTNRETRQASLAHGEPRFFALSQSMSLPEISANGEDRLLSKATPKSIPCLKSKEEDPRAIELTKYDETDAKLHESQMIYVNREQLIRLESDLKDALRRLTTLLSINDHRSSGGATLSGNAELREEIKRMDKEVQVDACSQPLESEYSEEQLNTPITRVSQIDVIDKDLLSKAKLTQMDQESNKENVEKPNAKRISDLTLDGSFLELENKLNIEHAKLVTINCQTQPRTPRIAKCKQKRSLREYMALKSSITFLETPDRRRFRSPGLLNSNNKPSLNASYISSKLLTDLDKLYSESPDIGS